MAVTTRTTSAAVLGILNLDYDSANAPSLTPFIETAALIVDRLVTCASGKNATFSTDEKEMIERWLAAWAYAMNDKPLQQKSTADASGTFVGQTGKQFDANYYGQMAQSLDPTGCLKDLMKPLTLVKIDWLGKVPSDQTPYEQRR